MPSANLQLVHELAAIVAEQTGCDVDRLLSRITFVKDRPGHDLRYAIDYRKVAGDLGWSPVILFEDGLEKTVRWYRSHPEWVKHTRSRSYQEWLQTNYADR